MFHLLPSWVSDYNHFSRVSVLLVTLLRMESWKDAGISVYLGPDNGHHALLSGSACCRHPCPKMETYTCDFPVFSVKEKICGLMEHWLGKEGQGRSTWAAAVQFICQGPIHAHCSWALKAFTCALDLPSLTAGHCWSKWHWNRKS